MDVVNNDLEALRREIDQLDERIHDLLMQRATKIARMPSIKGNDGRLFLRPGREAQIMRRLIGRHEGALPAGALARIWREVIGSLYRLQGEVKIAVHAPEKSVGYWDLGRGHFGAVIPMSLHRSPHTVLRLVTVQPNTIGVLALPNQGESDPWWPHLANEIPSTPRVIAKLPFVDDPLGRLENVVALVVARATPEPSGEDVSLLALSVKPDAISRARVAERLQQAGMPGHVVAGAAAAGGEELLLVEVDGFVAASDPRLGAFLASTEDAVVQAVVLGAYAVPLALAAPARPK